MWLTLQLFPFKLHPDHRHTSQRDRRLSFGRYDFANSDIASSLSVREVLGSPNILLELSNSVLGIKDGPYQKIEGARDVRLFLAECLMDSAMKNSAI